MTLQQAKALAADAGFTHVSIGKTRKPLDNFRHSKAHLYRWAFIPAGQADGPAIDLDYHRQSRTYPCL